MTDEEVDVTFRTTEDAHVLTYDDQGRRVEVTQQRRGYGMVIVRTPGAGEVERYYALDMAIDHAAELLGRDRLPVPAEADVLGI